MSGWEAAVLQQAGQVGELVIVDLLATDDIGMLRPDDVDADLLAMDPVVVAVVGA